MRCIGYKAQVLGGTWLTMYQMYVFNAMPYSTHAIRTLQGYSHNNKYYETLWKTTAESSLS
jgi:hypothetical protein